MPACSRSPRALAFAVATGAALFCGPVWAEVACSDAVKVTRARSTFETRTFQSKPLRRDARVEIEVRSTSTSAISALEFAVFLGASLADVEQTRGAALPTQRIRELPAGGIGFRTRVDAVLLPKARKEVTILRKAVPLDEDVYSVHVRVVDCRFLVEVGSATVQAPPEISVPVGWWIGVGLVGLLGLAVLIRQLA